MNRMMLMMALLISSGVQASDRDAAGALTRTRVFVENGTLTAASESAVFRLDAPSGHVRIVYPNGSAYEAQLSPASAKNTDFLRTAGFIWVDSNGSQGMNTASVCGGETETLIAAINLVTASCGPGGDPVICGNALAAASTAFGNWSGCMYRAFQQTQ